jgi:cellulose synthase operon protein C
MKRVLNDRLLAWLLTTLFVCAVGFHMLHVRAVRRHIGDFLRQADLAEARGEYGLSLRYLSAYLEGASGDLDAQLRYCLLQDRFGSSKKGLWRMFYLLEQVLRQQPGRSDLRRRLVDTAMSLERYTDAGLHLDVLLTEAPNDVELNLLRGRCAAADGDFMHAADWLRNAIERAPARIDLYVELATLLHARLDLPSEAAKVLDRMVAANPKSYEPYFICGRYRKDIGALKNAQQDFARAVEMAPRNADVLLEAIDLASGQGRMEEARKYAQRGLEAHPQDARFYATLAGLESQSRRPREAIACLRRGLQNLSQPTDLMPVLASLFIQGSEFSQAEEVIGQLRTSHANPVLADFLDTRLLIQKKRWDEAKGLLYEMRPRVADWPEMAGQVESLLGLCYAQHGDLDEQLAAYRRAAALDPSSATARAGLADTLQALGDTDEAIAEYREALRLRSPPETTPLNFAEALLQRTLRFPEDQRDWSELDRAVAQALASATDVVPVLVLRARLLALKGQPKEANDLLSRLCADHPQRVEPHVARVELATQRGAWPVALDLLRMAEQQLSDRLELRLARLHYWAARGGPDAPAGILALERRADRFSPEEQTRLFQAVSATLAEMGATTDAERLAHRLAERNPRDRYSRLLLIELALQTGNRTGLERIVADVRRQEGDQSLLSLYGDAVQLFMRARRGDWQALRDAHTRLAEVARRRPTWGRVPLLDAALNELEGDQLRAIENYLHAVELGERSPRAIGRAAELLYERHRYAEAGEVLRKLREPNALKGQVARLAADIALHTQGPEKALALAQQAAPAESRDYRDQLWLSRMFTAAGRTADATALLRRCVERNLSIPDVWVALVQQLADTQQAKEAEAAVDQMRRVLPPDRLPAALARCREALGLFELAADVYREAVLRNATDFLLLQAAASFHLRREQPAQAERYLRKMLDLRTQIPEENLAWARRQLALCQAASGEAAKIREALALLDLNPSTGSSPADERARARVLAGQPEHRREAIDLFEDSLRRQPLGLDDQFALATLYEADGNFTKAREQLVELVAAEAGKPAYLASFSRLLLAQGDLREAERWFARLEKLDPNGTRTREVRELLQRSRRAHPPARG